MYIHSLNLHITSSVMPFHTTSALIKTINKANSESAWALCKMWYMKSMPIPHDSFLKGIYIVSCVDIADIAGFLYQTILIEQTFLKMIKRKCSSKFIRYYDRFLGKPPN